MRSVTSDLDDGCLHDALDDSFLTSLRQCEEVHHLSDYDQQSLQDIAVLVDLILWELGETRDADHDADFCGNPNQWSEMWKLRGLQDSPVGEPTIAIFPRPKGEK